MKVVEYLTQEEVKSYAFNWGLLLSRVVFLGVLEGKNKQVILQVKNETPPCKQIKQSKIIQKGTETNKNIRVPRQKYPSKDKNIIVHHVMMCT